MTMLELKSILIHRISEINDIRFLEAIKTILDEKAEDSVIVLTDEQKQEIIQSGKEIKEGLFISNEELDTEIQAWLKAELSVLIRPVTSFHSDFRSDTQPQQ